MVRGGTEVMSIQLSSHLRSVWPTQHHMLVVQAYQADTHKYCQPSPHIHPPAQPGTQPAGPGQAQQGVVGAAGHVTW